MFVECFTNNAKPYLRLVQSVRVTKADARKAIEINLVCEDVAEEDETERTEDK